MNILNPKFRYIDSTHTDIRVTFDRVRRELEEQRKREPEQKPPKPVLKVLK